MKTIEVSESALESLKAMAQNLEEDRAILLETLRELADIVDGYIEDRRMDDEYLDSFTTQPARRAIAACQESTKVLES